MESNTPAVPSTPAATSSATEAAPTPAPAAKRKLIALQSFAGECGSFTCGREIEVPEDVVEDLIRSGHARKLETADATRGREQADKPVAGASATSQANDSKKDAEASTGKGAGKPAKKP